MAQSKQAARLKRTDVKPTRPLASLADDARHGLMVPPRSLPPKYFYDDKGSQLFEKICDTPEYYPTRTEAALLDAHAGDIVARVQPAHMLELGSGSSRKTRSLIRALDAQAQQPVYWPFDVSAQMMLDAGQSLIDDYPWLQVHALVGDYTGGLDNLPLPDDGERRLIVFLGGTLGNFEPQQATAILAEITALMGPDDALLLGLDRVKNAQRLEQAYDDAAGWTAAFNRNVLDVLNRELGANFPVQAYRHLACFDADLERIEMRLVAEHAHTVQLAALDTDIQIAEGEHLLTEISRKFTRDSISQLLASAGLVEWAHFEADSPDGQPDTADYSLVLAGRA